MSSLDNMSKRLTLMGGKAQLARMNKDKLKSLKKALWYSYQSATLVTQEEKEFRCLINPNKINNDYDVKILSIPYYEKCLNSLEEPDKEIATNIAVGQTFTWKENNSHWIIYLQRLEETAYFRAEIRRCRFAVEINGKKYWVYLRGPIETGMLWNRSGYTYFNKLNETAFMYIAKNDETEKFFSRFTKLKLGNQYWEVQATDKISVDGIIEVALKEDFVNKFDEPVREITKEDDRTDSMIIGAQAVKPYSVVSYWLKNIDAGGRWSVSDSTKARIKAELDNGGIALEIVTGKSGSFTLIYEIGEQRVELLIRILSL